MSPADFSLLSGRSCERRPDPIEVGHADPHIEVCF